MPTRLVADASEALRLYFVELVNGMPSRLINVVVDKVLRLPVQGLLLRLRHAKVCHSVFVYLCTPAACLDISLQADTPRLRDSARA